MAGVAEGRVGPVASLDRHPLTELRPVGMRGLQPVRAEFDAVRAFVKAMSKIKQPAVTVLAEFLDNRPVHFILRLMLAVDRLLSFALNLTR